LPTPYLFETSPARRAGPAAAVTAAGLDSVLRAGIVGSDIDQARCY
jgi:hypothetical protein